MLKLIISATIILLCAPALHSQEAVSTNVATVERFVAAFNAHDSEAMAEFVTEDVTWLSISGKNVVVEVEGKRELIASMNAYFTSCPTCQSELSDIISTPSRVSTIEIAHWQGKSGPRSQRSLSVYEFSGRLIQRVYYFPAEN